ncbi:MAG: hypothetical protein NUK65_09725 [Firmicutes bacterium]|nr:hypothetical protein [Bacillota bacterium]
MVVELLKRNTENIIKTGVLVIIASLAQQVMREQNNKTLSTAAQSIRKIKHEVRERKALQGGS